MKLFNALALAMLIGIGAVSGAQAASYTYTLEKAHTKVLFFVSHLGFSNFFGQFKQFDGNFTFDEKHPENSVIDVTVHPGSVDTGSEQLDKELTGESMFYASKYPDVRFKSTDIKVLGKNKGVVTGRLTIREVTRPVSLNVVFNKCGTHPMTKAYICGFTAKGVIKRSDFDLTEWKGMVGDIVTLHFEVEGVSTHSKDKLKRT